MVTVLMDSGLPVRCAAVPMPPAEKNYVDGTCACACACVCVCVCVVIQLRYKCNSRFTSDHASGILITASLAVLVHSIFIIHLHGY